MLVWRGMLAVVFLALAAWLALSGSVSHAQQARSEAGAYTIGWDRIPLRDGVELSAISYHPNAPARPACILSITPYGAQRRHAAAAWFASRGYPFFQVDSRGRGASGGDFRPNIQEGND